MSGTSPAVDSLGEPKPAPPEAASNDPRDIAAGVSREVSLSALLAANEAAAAAAEADPPAPEGASGPTPAPEGEGASGPTPAASDDETIDALLAKDNTPLWMKREITKTRNKQREESTARQTAETALQTERDAVAKLRAEIEALKPPPEPPKPATPRPTRDQFADPDAYDTAVQAWGEATAKAAADRAVEEVRAKAESEAAERRQAEAATAEQKRITAMQQTWQGKKAAAIEAHPDYVDVAERDDLQVSLPVAVMLAEAVENGAEVMYHLGKNPTEAARIYGLPEPAQLVEIGRLSATLANQSRPAVSRAPSPIRPLNASREQVVDTNREESMDEVAARVRKRDRWGTGLPVRAN